MRPWSLTTALAVVEREAASRGAESPALHQYGKRAKQWRVSSGVLPAAPSSRPEDRSRRLAWL